MRLKSPSYSFISWWFLFIRCPADVIRDRIKILALAVKKKRHFAFRIASIQSAISSASSGRNFCHRHVVSCDSRVSRFIRDIATRVNSNKLRKCQRVWPIFTLIYSLSHGSPPDTSFLWTIPYINIWMCMCSMLYLYIWLHSILLG